MKRQICLLILCAGALAPKVYPVVVWSEDFEGAALGATSGNNADLAGTVIQTANTASSVVVDATTDPSAAAAFTFASGKFIRLSTGANLYTAIRPDSGHNPIGFSQVPGTTTYTLSFDIHIPSTLSFAVGDVQPRFKLNGVGGDGPVDSTHAKSSAGQYHVVYTGQVSDFIGTDVNEARPFIGIDQGGAALADYLYMDNIHFELGGGGGGGLPPLNAAYFATLKAGTVSSTPLVEWQHFGPGMSGYIDKFWINNGDPDAMYDELDMGNGHVTLNRGEFWESYKLIDGNGLPGGITGIEFSYQNPDFGLLMAKEGIYSSTNRGRSWNFLLDIDTSNTQMHSVLAVDPSNDNNWYIGAGQHWMIKDTHFTKNGLYYSTDGNYSAGFILKSTNKGQSWTKIKSVFPADSDFSKIIVDPRNGNIVYASNQHGIYKSTNAGTTWSLLPGNGLPYTEPRDMGCFYDAGTGEFLLYVLLVTHYTPNGSTIATSGGVYRSADNGATWQNLTGDLGIDMSKVTLWGYRDKYQWAVSQYLVMDKAVFASTYPQYPTNTFSQFTRIAVDPTNKERIYLSHNFKHDYAFPPGDIWMTENGGTNWFAGAREGPYWINGIDAAYWNSRAIQPTGMNELLAHVDREHRENDYTQAGPRFVFCNQLGEVYTAISQQIMRSTDHGATWVQIDDDETSPGSGHWVGRGNSNLPGETFCLDTGTPGTYLWGSGEHGLWRNTGDGDLVYPGAIAMQQITGQSHVDYDSLSMSCIATHPTDKNKIYTLQFRQGHRGELRYSSNNGATWSTLSTPVVFPGANDVLDQRSLIIDHQNPNNIYFCIPFSEWERWSGPFLNNGRQFDGGTESFGQGIYKSTNGGLGFSMITNGLPSVCSVYRMAMDPVDPLVLYAALNETHNGDPGGLYKTVDGGASWSPVPIPAGINSVNSIAVHANGSIYMACGDSNGSTGGGYVSQDDGATWHLLFDMPYLRHFAPSLADPDIIAVSVDKNSTVGNRNPGAYLTVDGGANWFKINNRHGQPDGIRLIEPDPYDADVLWMSLHGTGFFRADISALRGGTPEPLFWGWMGDHGQKSMFGDADEDGFDSRMEYIADTDPGDGDSFFRLEIVPNQGSGSHIVFQSAANRRYAIYASGDLTAGWTLWTNGIAGTGGMIDLEDAEPASNRFYRVMVEME